MTLALPVVIGLLAAATLVAIGAKQARLPYNVALVLGGLALAVSGVLPGVPRLSPEVVFLLCLPALLFEGGITADLTSIRQNAVSIGTLSTLGMVIAIGATGAALHVLLDLPWGPAFLLGALLAVTDTVSILYAFRRSPVPPRLAGIMEGESLFNDGTALVVYTAIAALVVSGGEVQPLALAMGVVFKSLGGAAVGLGLGLGVDFLIRRTSDPLIEIMATTALALAAYTVAEQLHVSGVIAAVVAGLVIGATLQRNLAPQSRIAITSYWEYVAFGVNTFLFLSVGLAIEPAAVAANGFSIVLAAGAVFAGRAVGIYVPFLLLRWLRPAHAAPLRWQHVFVIGNIKGALSIALALGLPAVAEREFLIEITFGVTFVSLVFQTGLLFGSLKWLGLTRPDPAAHAVAGHQARLIAARAARAELEVLHGQGLVPRAGYDVLRGDYQVAIATAERELRAVQERHLTQGARILLATRRRLIDAERTAVMAARRGGLVAEDAAQELLRELERRIFELERVLAHEEEEKR